MFACRLGGKWRALPVETNRRRRRTRRGTLL
jgi:hypothetical protein